MSNNQLSTSKKAPRASKGNGIRGSNSSSTRSLHSSSNDNSSSHHSNSSSSSALGKTMRKRSPTPEGRRHTALQHNAMVKADV